MITSRCCSTTWRTGPRTFSPGTTFEESRNASAAAYQEALARQAFLLAREIYR